MEKVIAKPFVKWAGGKRRQAALILAHAPEKFGTLYEPFAGGAAVFFECASRGPVRAVLGDKNRLLGLTYIGVRDRVEDVISQLRLMPYDKDFFLEQRSRVMDPDHNQEPDEIAAWLIYLNRVCFNGLWRVNRKGVFNVPFGRYTNPTICDADNLRACSAALKRTVVKAGDDFHKTVKSAEKGDLVYCDPPYVPVSASADFTSYTVEGFTWEMQAQLCERAAEMKRRGVHVILSNADLPVVRKLYKGFKIERVEARRNINSDPSKRGAVGELLIT